MRRSDPTDSRPATAPDSAAGTQKQKVRMLTVGDEAGQRIDNYLARILKDVPKSRIYRMLRKGEVRVNGGRIKPTHKLQAGDQVRIPPHHSRPRSEQFVGSDRLRQIERAIVHEDERLLVLDKPAGIAVHGGSGVSYGVIEALRQLRPDASLELAHRLDRDTSGCLLIAKKRSVLRALHQQLREGSLEKKYQLIVHGRWPAECREVDAPLLRYVTASGERRVRVDPEGKPSRTSFRVEDTAPEATLLSAMLHTGRTHQIRVHADHVGHSLVGDEKYATAQLLAADRAQGIRRLCLHASQVSIEIGADRLDFHCPLPDPFKSAWRSFRR